MTYTSPRKSARKLRDIEARAERERIDREQAPFRPTRNLGLLLECVMCGGSGMVLGIIEAPYVTFCGCTSGMRLKCAVPEDARPLTFGAAARVADRIGLGPSVYRDGNGKPGRRHCPSPP